MNEIQIPTGYKPINVNIASNAITYELVEQFKQGDYVTMLICNIKHIGIYKGMNDNYIILSPIFDCSTYCLDRNISINKGSITEIRESDKKEVKFLNTTLLNEGLKYNRNIHELQHLLPRAKKNTEFYYIDQLCKVITAKDKYDEYHNNYTTQSKQDTAVPGKVIEYAGFCEHGRHFSITVGIAVHGTTIFFSLYVCSN